MAQWGRNDRGVTANSVTTVETSNGAPIGTYVYVKGDQINRKNAANAHFGNTSPGSRANVDVRMFNNTTPGAFISGQAVGVFGVSPVEMANNKANSSREHGAHAGWNLRRAGTGPIVSVGYTGTVSNAYSNTDTLTIVSPQAGGNATVAFTTNASGGNVVLRITNAGAGFTEVNATANVVYNGTTGVGLTFTARAGGRAGRVMTETLVAMGSLGSNAVSSTGVVGNANTVADASTDNTQYPGR